MGILGISSFVQYRLIFSAPKVFTSWSKCVQRTSLHPSILPRKTSNSNSCFPSWHSSRYFWNSSSPLWICRCCRKSSAAWRPRPVRNSGIFFAKWGKTWFSSILWWISRCWAKRSPSEMNCRIFIYGGSRPLVEASQSMFHDRRRSPCWMEWVSGKRDDRLP